MAQWFKQRERGAARGERKCSCPESLFVHDQARLLVCGWLNLIAVAVFCIIN